MALAHTRSADVPEVVAGGRPPRPRDSVRHAPDGRRGRGEQTRHRTFHYPHPNPKFDPDSDAELVDVLKNLGGEQSSVTARAGNPSYLRLGFVDLAALMLAVSRHASDEDQRELRRQVEATMGGAGALVRFAEAALALYLDARGKRVRLEAR